MSYTTASSVRWADTKETVISCDGSERRTINVYGLIKTACRAQGRLSAGCIVSEPRHEETCLRGSLLGPTQMGLYNHSCLIDA